MNSKLSKALSDDAGSLKKDILSIIASFSPDGVLVPSINPGAKKSEVRGWLHPATAKLLCPQRHLAALNSDYHRYDPHPGYLISTEAR
jgi:hypothetical protein